MMQTALIGFKLSLGLILVIGAQNAFVLRQGLRREHVLAVVLFCAISDATLIALGVSGLAALSAVAPWVQQVLRWGGVAFLLWYGLRSLRAAWAGGHALQAGGGTAESLASVLSTLAVLTWANPHVWLDTVVLIGSVAAQFPGERLEFGAGAATGSFVFFIALGFGARILSPLFARPATWRLLDLFVGGMMLWVAWSVATG
jgi:L-lysine exporter family protein LysE/ArgO